LRVSSVAGANLYRHAGSRPGILVLKPQVRDNVTGEDVIAWCRENVSYYRVPRSIELRESLPATGAGKGPRSLLKDEPTANDA
jgi:long-chain acyl-CoA synthetase